MRSLCIGIYGETCAGKSTVGKYLSSALGCRYISFGDLKREEIARSTGIGLEIQRLLESKCPLPAELGYTIIKDAIGDGLNIISGYLISVDEFNVLATRSLIIGILVLGVDEQTLIHRFGFRRECPECHIPGVIGDSCSVHKVPMIQREDVSLEELVSRKMLYRQRIAPFLASKYVEAPPRLLLDTSTLTKDDVVCRAEQWVRQLLTENGDTT
jgi:adenylate kinase family enzyme